MRSRNLSPYSPQHLGRELSGKLYSRRELYRGMEMFRKIQGHYSCNISLSSGPLPSSEPKGSTTGVLYTILPEKQKPLACPADGGGRRGQKIQLNYPSLSPQKTSDQLSRFQKNFFYVEKGVYTKISFLSIDKGEILAYLSQKEMFLACFWAPKKGSNLSPFQTTIY